MSQTKVAEKQQQSRYLGHNFTGLAMIKDIVIKPLLVATEKVVEYYFPDESKKEQTQVTHLPTLSSMDVHKHQSSGSGTKTTIDDTMSDLSELTKIKRRFKKLDICSLEDGNTSFRQKLESPKS